MVRIGIGEVEVDGLISIICDEIKGRGYNGRG